MILQLKSEQSLSSQKNQRERRRWNREIMRCQNEHNENRHRNREIMFQPHKMPPLNDSDSNSCMHPAKVRRVKSYCRSGFRRCGDLELSLFAHRRAGDVR